MEFLNPWAWFLALAVFPVIVFFFLKSRLREQTMSTSLFWDEIVDERRIRAFGYRFRHPLALFLSLLFLGLTIGAALDPVFTSRKNAMKTVIVFDHSGSMNAVDSRGNTRFELARNELLKLISRQESGRETAVITAGEEPEVVIGFTNHRPTLRDAVLGLRQTDAATSLDQAVDVAKILTQHDEDAQIVIFTDGCSPDMERLKQDRSVTIVAFGEPLDNVAITCFQVRRSLVEAVGFEIYAEVANFSDKVVRLRLTLELHGAKNGSPNNATDGTEENEIEVVDLLPIRLEPGAKEQIIAKGYTEKGGVVVGSLALDGETDSGSIVDFHDALAADNTACAVLTPRAKQKILYYGEDDFFLRNALESLPNVAIETITNLPKSVDSNSILVVHKTIPSTIPDGNVLIVDPRDDSDLFSVGETIESPIVGNLNNDSPLLKFVRLSNGFIPGARRLNLLSDIKPEILLATPENEPILLRLDFMTKKVVLLSADLEQGDLVLRTAFPILLSNTLAYFRSANEKMCPTDGPGESCGRNHRNESDLRTVWNDMDYRQISTLRHVAARPIWFWLVAAAALLIVLDWFLYHRRWVE